MKSFKGILFIIITMGSSALLWYFATPMENIHALNKLSHIIGGLAITGFFLVFLLATRNKTLEHWFHGLENVYMYHKYLAMLSIGLVILHAQLQDIVPDWDEAAETPLREFSEELGELAQYGFIALILVALFAKFLKYEHWRFIHRLLLLPYALGLYHTYFSSRYDLLQPTALGIFTAVTAIIGFMSALYMLTMYQDMQFKYEGKVTGIRKVSANAVALELTLNQKLAYQNGQFIFLKIFQKGLEKAPHPFSIAGGDGKKIVIIIKALGDFTKKVNDTIEMNTPITLEGPYGHLNFEKGHPHQIWIAGGVGITPFLSYLQARPIDHPIELFYTYRGQNEAIYKDFLQAYAKEHPQFTVHFIDTAISDRLNFESYPLPEDASVFMCGPKKMVKCFTKQINRQHTNADLHVEAFQWR